MAYELIEKIVVPSTVASLTIDNIPDTYKNLVLFYRGTRADSGFLKVLAYNSDNTLASGTNTGAVSESIGGVTAGSLASQPYTYPPFASVGRYFNNELHLASYSRTGAYGRGITIRGDMSLEDTTYGHGLSVNSLLNDTLPINKLYLVRNSLDSIEANSIFTLYGVS